jgi:outer membrane usher protein
VSGTLRHGLNDGVTVDLHGEGSARTQLAGAGVTWVWPQAGEFALHGAASSRSAVAVPDFETGEAGGRRYGFLTRASFARLGAEWSFSASLQSATAGFSQVGWEDSFLRVRQQRQLFVGRSLGRAGSLGASLTTIDYDQRDRIKLLSVSYSVPVGDRAQLSVYAALTASDRQPRSTTTGIALTVPLGPRQSTSVSVTNDRNGTSVSTEINEPPPSDAGWGYRAGITRGAIERSQAQALWRSPVTTLGIEAASEPGRTAVRATATGVVGYAGGRAFALQEASDAIAIVTVPGAPGITVYRENQPVARTDAEGRAVVPGLRPYDNNQLLIDANDLPISSQVRQGSMTVVPRLRGVATARFDISDSSKSSAGLRIVMPDGNLIEAGTTVRRVDHADEALVAGFSGAVWLSEPSEGERLRAPWNGGTCSVAVNGIPARGVLPDLGQRACTPDR